MGVRGTQGGQKKSKPMKNLEKNSYKISYDLSPQTDIFSQYLLGGPTSVQSFKLSTPVVNFLKNFEFSVISVFRAKKIEFHRNSYFKKSHLKDIRCIVLLAKSQVSDPSGSIFKKFPKMAYTLTLENERPVIKLPIGVHYHIFIDMCCVDTDFGSTEQRSGFCGQRFGCKKIKSRVKIFSMLSNGEN